MTKTISLFLFVSMLTAAAVEALSVVPAFKHRHCSKTSCTELKVHLNNNAVSRDAFWRSAAGSVILLPSLASVIGSRVPAAAAAEGDEVVLPSGVSYKVLTAGDGPVPNIGELVGIRFRAYCGDNKFDDIFDTPEPYYTRVGAGKLLKGVEEIIPKMRVGDNFLVTIPPSMAFGAKGRPSSAGKPRIPSNATILFDIKMVGLPGREEELIDLIGDV